MSSELRVRLLSAGLPGWVNLPLDVDDPVAWARARTVADSDGLGVVETSIGVDGAAGMLAAAAERAIALWPDDIASALSFAWQPDPLGPVLALCDVAVFPFEDEPFSADRMTALHGPAVGEIAETRMQIPLGPATVFTGQFLSEVTALQVAENRVGSASFAAIEARTIVVLPPELPGYLWVDAQWDDLQYGAYLAGQVDTIAAQLTLRFES